jgi:hypothetical protein
MLDFEDKLRETSGTPSISALKRETLSPYMCVYIICACRENPYFQPAHTHVHVIMEYQGIPYS